MSDKKYTIMLAIIWSLVGGMATLGFTKWFWATKIMPEMYEVLNECYKSKLDLIK